MKNIKFLFRFFLILFFVLSGTSLTYAIDNPHLIGQPQNINFSETGSSHKIAQSLLTDHGTQITSTGLPKYDLDWSPDNQWIVYEQEGNIFILKPAGSAAVNLTRDIDGYCSLPWFSDTSAGITFTNYRQFYGTYTLEYISVLRTDYSVILEGFGVACWSNNGRYLAYRDTNTSELIIYDYLFDTIKTIGDGDQAFGNICFSPDDKYVITSMFDNNLDAKLFRIPVGGGTPVQLTFNDGYHWEPEYSPDGKWIMYTDQYTMMLLAFNTETLESQYVFEDSGNSVGRFSQDGSQFCYLREIDGNNEVFVADFNPPETEEPLINVEVIAPNGGEILSAGQTFTIEWNTSGIANVNIEYTTDGGTSWKTIASGVNARFGSYDWLVPNVGSNRCRIRIASVALSTLVADQSDGNFTISKTEEQSGLVFKYQTDNEISLSSPAIGNDGTIYIGSMDGFLYAIKPDGTLKWRYRTNGSIWSSPAIGSNGVIYVGSNDTALHAVNPDGTGKWKYLTDGEIWVSPAIANNGDIYFGSFDNIFYAVKPDGTKKWEYEIGTMMVSSPSISLSGIIYFGAIDGNLYALRTDGTLKWSFPTNAEIYSSPAIGADGTVYVGNNNSIYAVNPDGTQKWNTYFENVVESSPAIGADGTIYVGVDNGYLYALNPFNGSIVWSFAAGDLIVSSPAIGNDGTIYIGSNEGILYAISPTGNEKWQFAADGSIWSSPTINDSGILYFGSYDFHLYAVDSKTTQGLADSSWPKFRHNTLNTGKKFTEATATLILTSPDGGENLLPGENFDITWSSDNVSNVNIEYSFNNGLSWTKIVDNVAAPLGIYNWSIPQGIDSSECLIRIIDSTDTTIKDKSNNPFSVSPSAFLDLTSRIGGEKLNVDSTYTIKWDSHSISNIDIKYSTDGGTTWKDIVSGVSASAGSYTWIIPADYSDNCKIMIADSSDSNTYESSIGAFSIQSNEFITITSPKFGDRWTAQSTKEITWEFSGISNVKIEYTSDNGTTWQTIIASTPAATGSYSWPVPDIEQNQCIVRITDTANSINTDDSDKFEIIIPELTITHTPITLAQQNEPITFTAVISSEDTIESVTLFYDRTGIRDFSAHEVSMVSSDGITYSTTLDVGAFTAYGLEYYILAKDVNNQNTRTPADKGYYSISATVSDMTSTETTTGGSAQNSYRMISIPLMIDSSYDTIEKQLSNLLPDGVNGTDWRLFRYSPGETTPNEYPDIETFTPGAAFWFISKNDFLFEAPSGSTVSTSGSYTITLKAGWNDIANPWMFDISWDDIENPSGATLSTLYTYDGAWSDPTNPPTTLEPWKGYAVNNMTNINVIIKLNPNLSENAGKPALKNDNISWQLSLNASAGRAKDNSNHFGLRQGALEEWDIYDHIEPPVIGEYVSVAFPHDDWERFPQSYTVDFRPDTSKNLSWDFKVTTNIPNENINLNIEGVDDLPEGYDYMVIDRTDGTLISLKDDSFSFISGSGITEKLFTITVGSDLTRDSREYSSLPGSFITARCYPNPFNPSTTIQYELPQPGHVYFTVFNSIGQIVHKKDIGQKEQGIHSFVFDASEMISGMYFYKIESEGASFTDKMIFMK